MKPTPRLEPKNAPELEKKLSRLIVKTDAQCREESQWGSSEFFARVLDAIKSEPDHQYRLGSALAAGHNKAEQQTISAVLPLL